jgi:BirA family biotin operon repressor/biotin-[acetyl-CoA-carboxylase] ligase
MSELQKAFWQPDNELTPAAILRGLGTFAIPREVQYYPEVSSTMDVARAQMQQLPPNALPLLVLTEEQLTGRGRLGRPWKAPPGSALLCSLALRPTLAASDLPTLVWLAGVSICEAIEAVTPLRPCLKWPNDVLLPSPANDMRKVAGILLETSSSGQSMQAIIGCGLNIHASPPDAQVRFPATSLSMSLGQPVSRLELLRAMLTRMDAWYHALLRQERDTLFAAWRARLWTLGRPVKISTSAGTLTGHALDVDPSGALHIQDAAGNSHIVSSGDVSG